MKSQKSVCEHAADPTAEQDETCWFELHEPQDKTSSSIILQKKLGRCVKWMRSSTDCIYGFRKCSRAHVVSMFDVISLSYVHVWLLPFFSHSFVFTLAQMRRVKTSGNNRWLTFHCTLRVKQRLEGAYTPVYLLLVWNPAGLRCLCCWCRSVFDSSVADKAAPVTSVIFCPHTWCAPSATWSVHIVAFHRTRLLS